MNHGSLSGGDVSVSQKTQKLKKTIFIVTFLCAASLTILSTDALAYLPDSVRGSTSGGPSILDNGPDWRRQGPVNPQAQEGRRRIPVNISGRQRNCTSTTVTAGPEDCILNMYHPMNTQNSCMKVIAHNAYDQVTFYFKEEYAQLNLAHVPPNIRAQFSELEDKQASQMPCANNRNYYIRYIAAQQAQVKCVNGQVYPAVEPKELEATLKYTHPSFPDGSCAEDANGRMINARPFAPRPKVYSTEQAAEQEKK